MAGTANGGLAMIQRNDELRPPQEALRLDRGWIRLDAVRQGYIAAG